MVTEVEELREALPKKSSRTRGRRGKEAQMRGIERRTDRQTEKKRGQKRRIGLGEAKRQAPVQRGSSQNGGIAREGERKKEE